jgi:CheY-like chemotaxis protein
MPDYLGAVLVIDDNPATLEYMQRVLTRAGILVEVSACVEEAKELLRTTVNITVVLIDLHMTKMRGDAFTLWIKGTFPNRQIAVIYVSETPDNTDGVHTNGSPIIANALDAQELLTLVWSRLKFIRFDTMLRGFKEEIKGDIAELLIRHSQSIKTDFIVHCTKTNTLCRAGVDQQFKDLSLDTLLVQGLIKKNPILTALVGVLFAISLFFGRQLYVAFVEKTQDIPPMVQKVTRLEHSIVDVQGEQSKLQNQQKTILHSLDIVQDRITGLNSLSMSKVTTK